MNLREIDTGTVLYHSLKSTSDDVNLHLTSVLPVSKDFAAVHSGSWQSWTQAASGYDQEVRPLTDFLASP